MPFSRITRLLLFFLLACNVVFSQNLPGNHYTSANELPNNTVRSLLVDSNNILWIGTDNGVVKKENDAFKSYFEEDGLALNSCWAIAEDANGNIWFGSYGAGLSIYDGEKFRVISKKDGLAHNEINRLYSYRDHMYIGTSDGVSRVNINSFEVQSWKSPLEDELLRVTGFFLHDQGVYISTYKTGIYRLTQNRENPDLVKVNDHRFIYSVFPENDSIYISNKGFFTKTGMEDYILKKHPEFAQYGSSIIWDHVKTANNKIYAAAWGIYDTNGGIFEIKDNQMISRAGDFNIPSKKIISLAYDKNFGKLYAGSMDAGLFEVQLDPQVEFHSIPGRDVYGFSFQGKNAAVLLDDGIFLKSRLGEKLISLVQLKDWQKAYVANTEIPLPRYEDSFYELDYSTPPAEISFYDIKASEGSFWVNTNIGIFAIKASGKLQRYIPLHSEEINFTEGGELIETHPYGGVRIYSDLEDFEYTHFRQEDPLTPTMVVNSLKKAGKTYLVSVFSGLYKWENGAFRSYLEDGTWQEKKLRHITQLNENLAISNEFGDVFIVNDEEEFRILKKIPRASIEGNSISFLKSHNGSLLIGTEKGLNLYKDGSFIFLNEEQGLEQPFLGAELNENILSIGSRGGFYQIDLSRVTDTEPLIHNLDIKEVYVNNGHFPVKNIADNKRIELQHDENTLLLKFSTNAHPYPKKLSYQYRLNPKDEWSLPSSKPEIFLPFLPPRKYEVSVNVLDSSTGLNHTQTLAELSILPPFWRTWWFGLLVFSSLLLIVLGVYRYQINQHRQFEEQKRLIQQRVEETKMEALLAQMNPHFIFNAMNSIQNYILDSDIDNATVFLGDFAKLIRLNLDHCTQPKILLIEEIEYLRSYIRLENTRFDNLVKVAIEIDPAIDPYDIEIPTMLLQTFVENVFVHAFPASVQEPTLEISFKLLPGNILLCKIEDNGVGYSPGVSNSVHQSKGISLVKERLSLLGYHVTEALQVKTSKNKGTTVVLKLHI